MEDRELLELAAKAAGINIEYCPDSGFYWVDSKYSGLWWSPLHVDGDALRLAVSLDLHVQCDFKEDDSRVYIYGGWIGIGVEEEVGALDKFAATRRAIVRAAAEIGRAMP